MYAKLENGVLKCPPKKVRYNGRTVFNPTDEMLVELGYYPVVYTDMPQEMQDTYFVSHWEQIGSEIVQKWEEEKIPIVEETEEIPTQEERIEALEQALLELAEVLTNG